MKTQSVFKAWPVNWLLFCFALAWAFTALAADPPSDAGWPRVSVNNGMTNTVYQPQLDSWDGYTLTAHCAASVQETGSPQPTFGMLSISAHTEVDKVQRQVYLQDLQLTKASFPSAPDKADQYLALFRQELPRQAKAIALDRLETGMAALKEQQAARGQQPLQNTPPKIIFSQNPALLISIDGAPALKPVEGTDMQRVINTRALLAKDASNQYYLHLFDGYLTAPDLKGPWTVASQPPAALKTVEQKAIASKSVDLLAGQPDPQTQQMPSLTTTPPPAIVVATAPTELIVIAGQPQWLEIPGTQLLYVTNTVADVFKDMQSQQNYVLISGRWFSGPSFNGPWQFVQGTSLPPDFAKIPNESPKENVKASVPGTQQAQEAVIANNIPQTAKVDRHSTQMDPPPQYDGNPQFKPIEGTELQYAVNTPTPVIKVGADAFYSCQNGMWFTSGNPAGPWAVAATVPAAIYSIPPSSPLYYVTYVKIYNATPDYVWTSYTPGYSGTVVSSDGLVVYGTGYAYTPWVGGIWVAPPVTYGYYANPCWTPWAGWGFGFAAGWAWGANYRYWAACPVAPYWGPYRGYCYGAAYKPYGGAAAWGAYGWAGTSGNIYHHSGAWNGVTRTSSGYNAATGNAWASHYGHSYNSVTGAQAVGQRGSVQNVYTGNSASGARGAAYNPQTGAAAAGKGVTVGDAAGAQATAGRGEVYNPNTGKATSVGGVKTDQGSVGHVGNDAYATHDGNVYRSTGQGWQDVSHPSGASAAQNEEAARSLQSEAQARDMGEQRAQSFQAHQPQFSGGGFHGGGGGFRGGGRR